MLLDDGIARKPTRANIVSFAKMPLLRWRILVFTLIPNDA